jgi:hypothetical protein
VRGEDIAGHVEDWTSGRRLAGARVSGLVTDEHGEVRGPVLTHPGTRWARIEVDAHEHVALHGWSDLAATGEHVYRLPRPAVIAGEVRSRAGPAAGAWVSFQTQEPIHVDGTIEETSPLHELPQGWTYELCEPSAVLADAQGRYRLAVLPWASNGKVSAIAVGFEGSSLLRAVGAPAFEHRVDVWMDGQPVTHTLVFGHVQVNGSSGSHAGSVAWRVGERTGLVTLQGGGFEAFVPPGDVHLVATLLRLPDAPSAEVVVHVDEGQQRGAVLDIIAPIATIAGRVRTEDGRPVTGARVGSWRNPGVRTDAEGAYVLHVTDLGRPYEVTLTLSDEDRHVLRGIQPGAKDVDFVVASGQRFFVRVLDGATGAVLQVVDPVQILSRAGDAGFREHPPSSMKRDAEGWFEFRSPHRELDLLAVPRVRRLPFHGTALAHARFDGEDQRIELVLRRAVPFLLELARDADPWPEGRELVLVEEELSRAPVNGEVWDELWQRRRVHFDERGQGRLDLAPGAYRLVPPETSWTVAPAHVQVEPGMPPVVVEWTRGD